MNCCPLSSSDDGDGPSFSTSTWRRAAKEHHCCECREPIQRGARHRYEVVCWDGSFSSWRTCETCAEIRDHFGCDGWIYEQLWDDLENNFFPEMTCGGRCMEGLSPAAKDRLITWRMEWLYDGGVAVWKRPAAKPRTEEDEQREREADLAAWLRDVEEEGRVARSRARYLAAIENARRGAEKVSSGW